MLPGEDRLRLLDGGGVLLLVLSVSGFLDELRVSRSGFLLVLGPALRLDKLASSASFVEEDLLWFEGRRGGRRKEEEVRTKLGNGACWRDDQVEKGRTGRSSSRKTFRSDAGDKDKEDPEGNDDAEVYEERKVHQLQKRSQAKWERARRESNVLLHKWLR
jgi:hypothetical protein